MKEITAERMKEFERQLQKHYTFALNYTNDPAAIWCLPRPQPRWWEFDTRPAVEGYQPPTLAEAIAAALVKGILK